MSEPPTIKQILHTADGITDKPMETKNERTYTQAEMDAAVAAVHLPRIAGVTISTHSQLSHTFRP